MLQTCLCRPSVVRSLRAPSAVKLSLQASSIQVVRDSSRAWSARSRTRPRTVFLGGRAYCMGAQKKEAPVGQWVSPISSQLITGQFIRLGAASIADGYVYWLEGRPTEGGRQVLVRRKLEGGDKEDVTPGPDSGLNVRTKVHEYGGGEYLAAGGSVFFSNFKDQRLYHQDVSGASPGQPEALTPADAKLRFADAVLDAKRQRLIAVREDHSGEGEAKNTIAAVSTASGESSVLAGGRDFYASPRLSPDGTQLAYVCWDHPNMPWDDTELWLAKLAEDGSVTSQDKVAGGKDESVMQPVWGTDGALYFISDRPSSHGAWWNIHRFDPPSGVVPVAPRAAEFGGPAWVFGQRSFQALPGGKLLVTYSDPKEAGGRAAVLDPASGTLDDLTLPYTSLGSLSLAQDGGGLHVATVAGSSKAPAEVALLTTADVAGLQGAKWRTVQKASSMEVDPAFVSEPETVEFPTEGGKTAFMNFYAPRNADYTLPPGHQPPLLVKIHGGPTAQASSAFSLAVQYWTSRGFGIADVNYGGSTGYGREYRNRLRGQWGVVDVDDCCNAAKHLAEKGEADSQRLTISGGSAGGYTTLACLAFRKVFSAGASHYGVADCSLLAQETHKFESRYLDLLIGPYPQEKATYEARSAINALDRFTTPCAFFQGTEDEIVPPNQAVIMYDGLKERGVPTALVMFEGEQHGFRSSNAIRRALDGERAFYGAVLGFEAKMPEDLEPIEVVNLPDKKAS